MTNEEAKKMLKAKLECLKNETSGINYDCNMRLCEGCSLNYEQGNMGEQEEALDMAIKTLGSWTKYLDALWKKAYARGCNEVLEKIREEIEKFNPVDYGSMFSYESHNGAKYMKADVLEIIDKYKTESEG